MSVVDPLNGTLLGKDYRVIEPIGRGGMAVVYLVEHETLKKRFAAKVLAAELAANSEARARFTQEAHSASQLDHENIVNISDFGTTEDQRPYFVMELLRGETLDVRLAAGPMSIEEVVAVTVPVCRALAFAHAEGIVHRDVKPENVFLVQRSQGRWTVKVVDFGIAKTPLNTKLTKMGQTLGSPHYMAPEACRGDDVDHRADIYSFGCLLFLMLCGRLPFEDESLLRVLQLQATAPVPPPRSINPALSQELADVIEGCLAKNPDDRYPSMEALLVDLEAAIPPGADRLLIEVQTRNTTAFRNTPFPSTTGSIPRMGDPSSSGRFSRPELAATPFPASTTGGVPASSTGGLNSPGAPAATPSAPNRKVAYLAAAIGVVFAAIGITVAMRGRSQGGSSAPATGSPTTTASAPAPAPGPGSSADSKPREIGPPVPLKVKLEVTTQPPGARVSLGGRDLGTTPIAVDVNQQSTEQQLVVSLSGYRKIEKTLTLNEDASLELTLDANEDSPVASSKGTRTPPKTTTRPKVTPAPKEPATTPTKAPNKGDPSLDIRMTR